MIQITTGLQCDRCKRWHARQDVLVAPALSREVEGIRDHARKQGWRHFRLKNTDPNTDPNSDLCPDCLKVLAKDQGQRTKDKTR